MAKKKIESELYSYGIYSKWDRSSKDLPKLMKITDQIPLELDMEFGYIILIKGAKGKRILFKIEHPPFRDNSGNIAEPFTGEIFIRTNDYKFFLGDTIWAPIIDKKGEWKLTTWLDGEIIIQKSLFIKES